MFGNFKKLLIACVMSTLAVLSLVGAITSTLSWYTYIAKAPISFHGTTIHSNKQLQVGILTDLDLSGLGLTTEYINEEDIPEVEPIIEDGIDTASGKKIAWGQPGDGLTSAQINAYLAGNGYATDLLSPVTTRRYTTNQGTKIKIYGSPYEYRPNNIIEAEKSKYSKIPLCFRVINSLDGSYCTDREVWISESEVIGSENEGFNVAKGVRTYFTSTEGNFIFNPSATEAGKTAVAGLLDLNFNGVYDYTPSTTYDGYYEEIIYGDYEKLDGPNFTYFENDSDFVDLNNTGKDSPYIFYSKHQGGVYGLEDYSSIDIQYAEYQSLSSVAPSVNENLGIYEGGMPVCKTGSNFIGFSDMYIWIEGWDNEVVNQVWSLSFNLGVTFEINKI